MIVVRLCGGLGNQLFQYATGRRLADSRGAELVLDLAWYERTPSFNTPRKYELDRYPVRARTTTATEDWSCRLHGVRLLRSVPIVRRWRNFRERSFDFDPSVLSLPDDTYLDGYWQSDRYFADVSDAIRVEATPRSPAGTQDRRVGEAIAATSAVSVHVRRGDYVSQRAAAAFHGTCSPDYYRAALAMIVRHVPNPHFFVFSDDVDWARRHIAPLGPIVFVDHNGPDAAFQDLRLMASCKHHVIANSSFSWWGAWLNPQTDKVVVAPKLWFADGRSTPTLMPSTWIRL